MHKLDYNTSKKKLVLPEYGRNIQKMVEHVMKIEDRKERNEAARAIIVIMGNLNPHLRDVSDFKHKLWDHLAIMSDFSLDIDYPYTPPTLETLAEKPKTLPYNNNNMRYRYYGRIIEELIRKVGLIENAERKNILISVITNHMKKAYIMWNKEIVSDDIIFEHLRELSRGKLIATADLKLSDPRDLAKNLKKGHTVSNVNGNSNSINNNNNNNSNSGNSKRMIRS